MDALTTLANVKAWVISTNTTDDVLLTRLIGQASRLILAYIERPSIYLKTYTDTLNGFGSRRIMLRQWPVVSVSSLIIGECTVPAAPALPLSGGGYTLQPYDGEPPGRMQELSLSCYEFWRGLNNIIAAYQAGYCIQNEAATIPAISAYTITTQQPYGNWMVDNGVSYAAGGALAPIPSGTPSTGQYTVSAGVYTFAAADEGKAVLISYSYVPFDVEQACIEAVGERYKYMQHVGEKSKSQSGQVTISYDNAGLTNYSQLILNPYKRAAVL